MDSLYYQVGVREATGRNDGIRVEEYQRSVGLRSGQPYCAAGIYWCFYASVKDMQASGIEIELSEIPIIRTGLATAIYYDAVRRGEKSTGYDVGDLMVWRKGKTAFGHIERIIDKGEKGWVKTIGFNTTNGKSGKEREGDGVFARRRHTANPIGSMIVLGFVRFKLINNESNNHTYTPECWWLLHARDSN